jgi:TonB-dependent receptor
MHKPSFHKTPLATGVALALGATAASPALAQQASDDVIEEVVTVGIRSSLISSMNTKRNAKGVVDAITAEDIGKFPDTNLAESMQRIPGVSIDRANNEGSKVTVRGFGPDFNLVLLNGRQMPTTNLSADSNRSWDFANIATEGIRAVNVYKTFSAVRPSGGIGSTIDLITAKPFDNPGLVASFGVKAMSDTSNVNGDDFTPEFSGILSNTFLDDTIGIGGFFTYQERDSRIQGTQIALWRENLEDTNPPSPTMPLTDNRTDPDGNTWYPRNLESFDEDVSRTRINGQLVLQWAPTDMLTASLDYTYAKFENEGIRDTFGIWFDGFPETGQAELDENGTYVFVEEFNNELSSNQRLNESYNEVNSIGMNLDWQVTDDLTLTLDIHDSDSVSRGTGRGSDVFLIMGAPCIGNKIMDARTGNEIPDRRITWDNCFGANPDGTPSEATHDSLFAQAGSPINESDVQQLQLGGEWFNDDDYGITSIQFGASYLETEYRSRDFNTGQVQGGWFGGNQGLYDDSLFTRIDSSDIADDFSGGGANSDPGFYYTFDFEETLRTFEANFCPATGSPGSCTNDQFISTPWDSTPVSDHTIKEETTSVYMQFNAEGDFNGFPVTMVGGIRYEDTDVTANSLQLETEAIVWSSPTEWSVVRTPNPGLSDAGGDYSLWLPNLDVSVDVRDDMITRFSYSKSVTRPTLTAMRGTTSLTDRPQPGQRTGDAGNPALLPFESDNFDLSFEWYYNEGSYASIGYYRKQVDNFIVKEQSDEQFPQLRDPFNGPRAAQARADIEAAGGDPNDIDAIHNQININAGNPIGTAIVQADDDPVATWRISRDQNLETATLYGWELAIQHLFGDSGFGVAANYTTVNGDINVDNSIVGFQFVLPGLSDSANLVGFYEADRWQVRVAYNWRDEFLNGTPDNQPEYIEEFAQWDMNASFSITDNLNVFVEGLNITNESQRIYNRYLVQLKNANQFEARYNIGARYTFN